LFPDHELVEWREPRRQKTLQNFVRSRPLQGLQASRRLRPDTSRSKVGRVSCSFLNGEQEKHLQRQTYPQRFSFTPHKSLRLYSIHHISIVIEIYSKCFAVTNRSINLDSNIIDSTLFDLCKATHSRYQVSSLASISSIVPMNYGRFLKRWAARARKC